LALQEALIARDIEPKAERDKNFLLENID